MIRCSACEDEDPPYFRCLICVDYRLCQLCYTSSFARWSLLLTGVAYGTFWQSRYTKKELAMKDIKEAEKAKRDAKIAAEKAAAAAAELAELEKLSK